MTKTAQKNNRLINWLRWARVLPFAVGAFILCDFVIRFTTNPLTPSEWTFGQGVLRNMLGGAVFVVSGTNFAPSHKLNTAMTLAWLAVIPVTVMTVMGIVVGLYLDAIEVAMLGVGAVVAYRYVRNDVLYEPMN